MGDGCTVVPLSLDELHGARLVNPFRARASIVRVMSL